ncbi:hypothetical protein DFH07DRAFT_1065294 [Mycena maculata]|uniref:Uncharacterized protein n=1 Tax=Mycena maculata TaxID=230809 RepID=A0AAD7I3K1_9AGAR|nr:hypothetical protein DFH07DRAFT_1065294 [Mycena maculata]
MKVLRVVCALAFSFASCVAAQSSTFATPSPFEEATGVTFTGTAVAAAPSFGTATTQKNGNPSAITPGPVIGAAVLLIVAAFVFGLHYRRARCMTAVAVVNAPDTSTRCDDLERQLRALREQVVQLEGQQLAYNGVLYTHEKDEEKADRKSITVKEALPTYAD